MTRVVFDGGQVVSVTEDPGDAAFYATAATEDDLLAKIDAAIAVNVAYLALPAPTQAQAVAQVERLTREVTALLRVVGRRLDSTEGT